MTRMCPRGVWHDVVLWKPWSMKLRIGTRCQTTCDIKEELEDIF